MNSFTIYCECEDFGWEVEKNIDETFTLIIANIEFEIGCQLLSFFGGTHWSERDQIFDLCADVFKLSDKMKKKLWNKQVICIEGVEKAWEVLLQYRQFCSKQQNDIDNQIRSIIKIIVYCQTFCLKPKAEELEINEFIITQSARGYRDNLAWLVSRGRFIYTHNERLNPLDSRLRDEMERKFHENYSITLKNYFVIISSIVSRFHEINGQWFKRLRNESFFKEYPLDLNRSLSSLEMLRIDVEALLEKLSFSSKEFDIVFQDNDKCFVDFCIKRPFLKLLDGIFVPITIKWIDDLLWVSLYYKIADCYDDKEVFYRLFGRLFENYVSYLTEKTCNHHKNGYQYLPEFSYGKPQKKSPDAMISVYNKTDNINEVLVIEAKSARLLYDMKKDGFKQDDIAKSLKKVVFDPLSQAEKAIADIIQKGVCKEITEDKFFCILCVTMENIPFQVEIENNQYDMSVKAKNIDAIHMAVCIEEFEMLMQLISQPEYDSVARDIYFYILDQAEVIRYCDILSFKNYIKRNTIYPQIYESPGTMTSIREELGRVFQIDILPDNTKRILTKNIESLY